MQQIFPLGGGGNQKRSENERLLDKKNSITAGVKWLKAQKCVSGYKRSIIDQNISQTPPHDTSLSQALIILD